MLARGTLRGVFRSARPPAQLYRNQIRLASEDRPKRKPASSPRLLAGLAGAALLFVAGYNHYSNSKSIDSAASSAKSQLNKLSQDIPSNAPESNQAIPWLQSTATAYAVFIPEQKSFIDSVFNDLEVVQQKHGKRVDEIIQIAHQELKDATKNGLDFESVGNAWGVLEKAINQIGNLDAEPTNDVQGQHPDMKEKVGEKLDQLKKMAEDYGPEARKELEDVYQRMKDVLGGGLGSESAEKIRKLIQEKIQTIEKFGDVAWERGLEEVKPYSDKNPEIRVILLENRENLKHGNLGELWDKVRVAAQSGNTEELQKHVKEQEKRGRSG